MNNNTAYVAAGLLFAAAVLSSATAQTDPAAPTGAPGGTAPADPAQPAARSLPGDPAGGTSSSRELADRLIRAAEIKTLRTHLESLMKEELELERSVASAGEAERPALESRLSALVKWRAEVESRIITYAKEGKAPETGKARVRQEADGLIKRLHRIPAASGISLLACSADGLLIAVGRKRSPDDDSYRNRLTELSPWSVEILDAATGAHIKGWDVMTPEEGRLAKTLKNLTDSEISALAFSPDGNLLAIGMGFGHVKICHARTGRLLMTLDGNPGEDEAGALKALKRAQGSLTSLAFSPDSALLVTAGGSFRDAADSEGDTERLTRPVTGPGRLKIWDVQTGILRQGTAVHSRVGGLAISRDGNLLASAGSWENGNEHGTGVIVQEFPSCTKLCAIAESANGGTCAVAFSPDGKLLVTGSRRFDKDDGSSSTLISVAHARTGITEWQRVFPGRADPAAFLPDGKTIAVQCGENLIRLIDAGAGTVTQEIQCSGGRITGFAAAVQTGLLATGSVDTADNAQIEIWVPDSTATSPVPNLLRR